MGGSKRVALPTPGMTQTHRKPAAEAAQSRERELTLFIDTIPALAWIIEVHRGRLLAKRNEGPARLFLCSIPCGGG
jgi:hypothetical protein